MLVLLRPDCHEAEACPGAYDDASGRNRSYWPIALWTSEELWSPEQNEVVNEDVPRDVANARSQKGRAVEEGYPFRTLVFRCVIVPSVLRSPLTKERV